MAKKRSKFIYGKGRPALGIENKIREVIGSHRRHSLGEEYPRFGELLQKLITEAASLDKDEHGRVSLGPTRRGTEFFVGPYDSDYQPRLQMPVPADSLHAEHAACYAFSFEDGVGFSESYTTEYADPNNLKDKKELSLAALERVQEVIAEKLEVISGQT